MYVRGLCAQYWFAEDVYTAAAIDVSLLLVWLYRDGIGKYCGCGETECRVTLEIRARD